MSKSNLNTSSSEQGSIAVKVTYKESTRKFRIDDDTRLSELRTQIAAKFDISSKFKLDYLDADGDQISLVSQNDWEDCLEETPANVRLIITSSGTSSSSNKSRSSRRRKEDSSVTSNIQNMLSVFDSLLQATVVIDEKGTMHYANPSAEKLTGYLKSELTGRNVRMLMPEEFAREHDSYLQNYIRSGVAKVIGTGRNVTLMTKDGMYVPSFLQVTENRATGKRLFVGTLSDARDERKEQSVLGMVREVLNNLVNPAIAITEKGVIQVFNKQAQTLWGYSLTEVVGKNVKMLMPSEYADKHDTFLSNYMNTGKAKIIGTGRDVPVQLKDGTIKSVHLSISERKDGDSSIFSGVCAVTDSKPASSKK